MNIQGAVTLRTEFTDRDRKVNRSSTSPLTPGGNERFNVVEFDKVIGAMVDEARGVIVAEFGEPRDYQNPRKTAAEYKERIQSLESELEDQKAEVERLKNRIDIQGSDLVAGGGSASAWYQGINNALGVGAGGLNVKLEDCKHLIEILKERSHALRRIEEFQKGRFGSTDAMVDGKPI